ncbi:DUF6404 family protein [Photobacterium aquimaris]|uniref:DUF6404 family protein n=1 Tax=Photobacterium aquimaris TaxID=512643 RepID=UPI001F0BFA1E|nr:DUF6404 family protein [Photobacterium aquimaris]
MKRADFIQLYLEEKGVNRYLTKPYPACLILFQANPKPRLFESPLKLFVLQSVFGSLSWGFFMWLIIWKFEEFSAYYLYAIVFFGVFTAAILAVNVARAQKKV